MAHKQPTPIVDKNGKLTTVHKKADNNAQPSRTSRLQPSSAAEQAFSKQMTYLSDLTVQARTAPPDAHHVGVGIDALGEDMITDVQDESGATLYWSQERTNPDTDYSAIYDINFSLRQLDVKRGLDRGYLIHGGISPDTAFTIDLDAVEAYTAQH
jgi:hypothetical protein